MRDIKFRGKNNGKFIYGSLIVRLNGDCLIIFEVNQTVHELQVVPETVGEYTGRKDKNGKEIYEGDIVRHERNIEKCTNPYTQDYDEDVNILRTGKVSITTSLGVCLSGEKTVTDNLEDVVIETEKYYGNPGSYNRFSEIIGNIHE